MDRSMNNMVKGKNVGYRVYSYIRGSIEADEGIFTTREAAQAHATKIRGACHSLRIVEES